MADQIHWPQVPLVGGEEALAFPLLGSTRQRKPWQPRAHASGCAAWCGRHHTGKPARGPRNGPQSRRTRGNSRQYLQQGPGAAYEGQPGRKQHPSEDQELWKAGQTTRLQLRVVGPIEDGLGWIHPAQNSELRELRFVDGGRQVLLAECAGPGQAVGVKHDGVVGGGALVRTRPIRGVSGVQPSTSLLSGSHRSQVSSRG